MATADRIADTQSAIHSAQRFQSAAYKQTLTNNPALELELQLASRNLAQQAAVMLGAAVVEGATVFSNLQVYYDGVLQEGTVAQSNFVIDEETGTITGINLLGIEA